MEKEFDRFKPRPKSNKKTSKTISRDIYVMSPNGITGEVYREESANIERFHEKTEQVNQNEEGDTTPDYYQRKKKFDHYSQFAALLTDNQIDLLTAIAKQSMRNRKKFARQDHSERITGNSVLRALINRFSTWADLVDLSNIQNEADLEKEIERVLLRK